MSGRQADGQAPAEGSPPAGAGKPAGGRRIASCPTCGLPLEATVRVYLVDVAVDERGRIIEGRIDYHEGQTTILDFANDELVEVWLMCPDDHDCEQLLNPAV